MAKASHDVTLPAQLAWVAGLVVAMYAASLLFDWSAGWQVVILIAADILAFVMFLIITLRRE